MISVVYGFDTYRKQKRAGEIVAIYKRKHPQFVLREFDFEEEGSAELLRDFLKSHSLFESINFAYVKNLLSARVPASTKNLLREYIDSKNSYILLYGNNTIPKGFEFLNKEPTVIQCFDKMDKEKMLIFISKEAEALKLDVSSEEIKILIDIYGSDTDAIMREVNKVALGGLADNSETPGNFFALISSISSDRNYRAKLPALERLFASKEDSAKIFNILASILVKKGMKAEEMAQYDIAVKSGKLDYEAVLVDFCLR